MSLEQVRDHLRKWQYQMPELEHVDACITRLNLDSANKPLFCRTVMGTIEFIEENTSIDKLSKAQFLVNSIIR